MSDLVRQLNLFRNEIDKAIMSYSAWHSFHDLASSDRSAYSAFNRNAAYWNISQYTLQMSYYVALGRVFDCNEKSISIFKLVRSCKKNINDFSKASLAVRKGSELWTEEYKANVYTPSLRDFENIRLKVKAVKQLFDDKIQPVRHKVFAHLNDDTVDNTKDLFAKITISELEGVLHFLDQLYRYIWELYYNGRLIDIDDGVFSMNDRVSSDLQKISENLKNA
ncbi:AbiU2 domain-containing protein [Nitrincola alkalisediminis]|uniref:AbiU2 domain-containing protein n=1 Tax=Nitrincola alkalisediminis TaxID=1366656 RepID=UPI0018744E3F|nr:hypothetical protein [Nitrincola alkalisediminis]